MFPRKINGESVYVWQGWVKICEHVQIGDQRGALVHVLVVAAGPVERFSGSVFDAGQIDVPVLQRRHILRREIVADDAHYPHRRELRSRQRKITRRTTQHAVALPVGRFNSIERYRTNDQ